MSPLRDMFVSPRPVQATVDGGFEHPRRGHPAPSLGLLATSRDLPAAAAAAGLAIARRAPAVLVCVATPWPASALRAPARSGAARLAGSLRARGLNASARGRLALVGLPEERLADGAAHALAAAGAFPSVLAVAARDDEVDALLATRDAILVALPPSVEPALAQLAVAGAAALAPAASLTLSLDPLQRALALAGVRAPQAMAAAAQELPA
jgi:hypothetical protein